MGKWTAFWSRIWGAGDATPVPHDQVECGGKDLTITASPDRPTDYILDGARVSIGSDTARPETIEGVAFQGPGVVNLNAYAYLLRPSFSEFEGFDGVDLVVAPGADVLLATGTIRVLHVKSGASCTGDPEGALRAPNRRRGGGHFAKR